MRSIFTLVCQNPVVVIKQDLETDTCVNDSNNYN